MTSSEMKRWMVAIGVIVVCSGGYMLYTSSTEEGHSSVDPGIHTQAKNNDTKNEENNVEKARNDDSNVKKEEEKKIPDTAFGITADNKDENVTIKGYITTISSGKGHMFPVIKDPTTNKTIKGVIFASKKDSEKEEVNERQKFIEKRRKDGKLVTIEGKVSVYNDEVDVIIKKAY